MRLLLSYNSSEMAKRKPSKKKKRPPKDPDALVKIQQAVASGEFEDRVHTQERQDEREVTRSEYVHVLETGYHERKKDEFKEEFQAWNYAIRGKTIDGRELRVPVSFDDGTLLIVTVIDLDRP